MVCRPGRTLYDHRDGVRMSSQGLTIQECLLKTCLREEFLGSADRQGYLSGFSTY